jgi:hypothetical protein
MCVNYEALAAKLCKIHRFVKQALGLLIRQEYEDGIFLGITIYKTCF